MRACFLNSLMAAACAVHGRMDVIDGAGEVTATLTPADDENSAGGWLGEMWDPNQPPDYWSQPHHWKAGFRARDHSLLVAFDRRALHDVIASRPALRAASEHAEVSDLWGKLRATKRQAAANVYRAMLEMADADGRSDPGEAALLARFEQARPDAAIRAKRDRAEVTAEGGSDPQVIWFGLGDDQDAPDDAAPSALSAPARGTDVA